MSQYKKSTSKINIHRKIIWNNRRISVEEDRKLNPNYCTHTLPSEKDLGGLVSMHQDPELAVKGQPMFRP